MKHSVKSIVCVALTAAATFSAAAQNRSAYFLDNYSYGYQLNPAFARDGKGEVSFPLLGSLNLGVSSNFGVKTFLPQVNGQTVTFLHPDADFKAKGRYRLGFDLNENIINVGFKAFGGYNHVAINAKSTVQMRLPGALFSFVKEGIQNKNYEIGRFDLHGDAYGEVVLNHARDLGNLLPGLKVGASFKFLVGIANADFNMNKADLNLGVDEWTVTTEGKAQVSMKGMTWDLDDDNHIDGINTDDVSAPSGYGIAFDLGATYEWKDFTFGLAFNDIGFINWSETIEAGTRGEHRFSTNDYVIDPGDFDSSLDKMTDDIEDLYDLRGEPGVKSRTRAIEATMNASVEYTLPMYRAVSFGVLNTTRLAHRFAWTDFRFSANFTPAKWFGMAVNYGIGTFGSSFGWMLNLAPKGFNIYLGMDHTIGKLSKQYVPLNLNTQFSFGLNFPF